MWPKDYRVDRKGPPFLQQPFLSPLVAKTDFGQAVEDAKKSPFQPILGQDGKKDERTTFGPDDPQLGVYGAGVTPFKWPFRIFADAGVNPTDNDALRKQMAATGILDPKPFGTRPAAPANAEYEIRPGQMVFALDETRMGQLEEQRGLLAKIADPKNVGEKDKLTEQLQDSVIREIDYAATQQAVPDFDALVAPLAQRAPDDPTYKAAIDQARTHYENRWKVDGRTNDQIGKLIEGAKDGNYDDVRAEAKRQFVTIGDEARKELGDKATPEAISAAIAKRAGVYLTFDASNAADPKTSAYLDAVRQAQADANKEIFVDRPVAEIRKAAGLDPNGTDVPELNERQTTDLLKKLAEVTDPQKMMPKQVQDILTDPRIFSAKPEKTDPNHDAKIKDWKPGLLNQAVDRLTAWEPKGDGPYDGMIPNFSAIVQNAVDSDGGKPGKGKALADGLAAQVMDRMPADPSKGSGVGPKNMFADMQYSGPEMRKAASNGNVAFSLSLADKADIAGGRDAVVHKNDKYYHNFNHALRDNALDTVRQGLDDFDKRLKDQTDQLVKDAGFFAHPLVNYGQNRTKAQQLEDIEAMRKADPDAAKKYDASVAENGRLHEDRDAIQRTVNLYKGDLGGVDGFDKPAVGSSPLRPETKHDSVVKTADALPKPLGEDKAPDTSTQPSLWFQRSQRLFATHFTLEGLKSVLPPDRFRYVLTGGEGMSQADLNRIGADNWYNPRLLSRFSGGLSSYLFMQNSIGLAEDPTSRWNDYLYVPVHGAMALSALASTALPDDWKASIWGTDADGRANTPFNQRYNAALGRINKLSASDGVKAALRHIAGGVLKDVPDAAYVVIDAVNSGAYFSRGDWVRGVAFGLSAAGDAAFMTGAAASLATGGTILGLSAAAWTGIGAVAMLIASGINYFKGMYDNAHTYDGADQRYLEYRGVKSEIAEVVSRARSRTDGGYSAGPVLVAAFKRAGKTEEDLVKWLNGLTSDQADNMATQAKDLNVRTDGKPPQTDDFNSGTLDTSKTKDPRLWNVQMTPASIQGFLNWTAWHGMPIG